MEYRSDPSIARNGATEPASHTAARWPGDSQRVRAIRVNRLAEKNKKKTILIALQKPWPSTE